MKVPYLVITESKLIIKQLNGCGWLDSCLFQAAVKNVCAQFLVPAHQKESWTACQTQIYAIEDFVTVVREIHSKWILTILAVYVYMSYYFMANF